MKKWTTGKVYIGHLSHARQWSALLHLHFCFGLVLAFLSGCYGINEKTSEIGSLNTTCLKTQAWEDIRKQYSTEYIDDPVFLEKLEGFKKLPFETEVLFFREGPKELIGISTNHYSVEYVFNPEITSQIEHGMSPELSEAEKKRIRNRVQRLLLPYQCYEGRKRSLEMMSGN